MDALADRLTSYDIARWRAYFGVSQELALESLGGGVSLERESGAAGDRKVFRELDEAGLHALFRAHNERVANG